MTEKYFNPTLLPGIRIFFCLVLFEYSLFIFSGVSFSFLSGDPFFNIGADLLFWLVYGLQIPQFIIAHYALGYLFDAMIISLLIYFIYKPFNNKIAVILLLLLVLFYITLMGYLTHRNFQIGFFVVFIPFIFKNDLSKYYAFQATRYFLLIFYTSSAILKVFNNSLADHNHLSYIVSGQFTPYFLEGNISFRTDLNLWLIGHAGVGYLLYLLSFIAELIVMIGFFTKKFDKILAVSLLGFHFMNWLIMDIAPFGQLSFICLLFLSKSFNLSAENRN